MDYVAYMYDKEWNLLAQVFDLNNVGISDRSNSISECSFELFYGNAELKYSNFKEFTRIKIMEVGAEDTNVFFEGVVVMATADIDKVVIKCEGFGYLFKSKRYLSGDLNWNDSIMGLLAEVLDEINGNENMGITLDCDVSQSVDKTYKKGTSLYDILDDLTAGGYEWTVRNRVIIFKELIGIDRSVEGDDFVSFRWDRDNMDDNTVGKVTSMYNADNIATVAVDSSTGNSYADTSGSIDVFERIEVQMKGGTEDVVVGWLGERNESVREYDITAETNDYFLANVGDIVDVYIYTGSDMLFYEGTMKVVGKRLSQGDLTLVNYQLSKSQVRTLTTKEGLAKLNARVKRLELEG